MPSDAQIDVMSARALAMGGKVTITTPQMHPPAPDYRGTFASNVTSPGSVLVE